jgi:putative ABC transport system permease protein
MLKTSLRNLAAHKLRTAATAVAVALGVAFLAGTLVLADTVRVALDATFAHSYAGTDAYVRAAPSFSNSDREQRPRLDADLVGTVASVGGVAAAEGRIEGYAQLLDRQGDPVGDPDEAFGTNWSRLDEANPFRLVAGRAPNADDEVIIDRGSAKATGYRVGDGARVATKTGSRDVTVVGIAAFGTADSPARSSFVLFTQAAAEQLIAQPGRVDAIVAVAAGGVAPEEIRARIAAATGPGVEVLTGADLLAEKRGGITEGVTKAIRTLLLAFAAVALFVGAFIIHNTFSILVAQRTREVALTRALGATRRQVIASVLVEAAVLGLVGAAVGALGGVGVAAGLRGLVGTLGVDIPAGDLVVRGSSLLVPIVVGVAVTVASAVLPARRASSVPPIAALRDAAVDSSATSRRRVVTGSVLVALGSVLVFAPILAGAEGPVLIGLGAAVVFLGLAALGPVLAPPVIRLLAHPVRGFAGVPLELARESAARNARRTSGAAASLMIGIGLVTLISLFAASAKATVSRPWSGRSVATPDFVIEPAVMDSPGFSPELARRLEGLPEVDMVATARATLAQVGADPGLHVHGVDPSRWNAMIDDGTVQGSSAHLADNEISVLDSLARMKGWSMGGPIALRFADTGERQYRIVATRSSGPPFLLNLRAYEAAVADQLDTKVLVKKAEGVSPEAAEAAVRAVVKEYPAATLLDERGKSSQQLASIDQFANAVYVLLALAMVIALIGIGTTLALSVVERTREIGLLRAVGMTREQVRAMVRWESLLIALFGSGLGLFVGLFFGWATLQGLPDQVAFRVPVVQVAVVTAIAAGAAMLAAAGPARRGAQLDVLSALSRP